jgi:hypothetical protein
MYYSLFIDLEELPSGTLSAELSKKGCLPTDQLPENLVPARSDASFI